MRRLIIGLSAGLAMLLGTVSVFAAGFNVGINANLVDIEASGSEKDSLDPNDASILSTTVQNDEWIGSYFLELTMGDNDRFALGYEAIPGSADVSDKAHSRSDTEKSVTGDVTQNSTARTFKADANIEDFSVIYAEVPLGDLIYIRAGLTQLTVITKETASGNGGSYGNADLDGIQYGIGVKGLVRDRFSRKLS